MPMKPDTYVHGYVYHRIRVTSCQMSLLTPVTLALVRPRFARIFRPAWTTVRLCFRGRRRKRRRKRRRGRIKKGGRRGEREEEMTTTTLNKAVGEKCISRENDSQVERE